MKFRSAHKLTTYLTVASAVGTVATSDAMPMMTLLLTVVGAVISWKADPEAWLGRVMTRGDGWMKALAFLFFVFSLFGIYKSFPEPDASELLNLVLFLTVFKLLQRRGNRDYLQIYILAFLLMLAAAWLAQSVAFALGFAAYVIFATWALILFHLRREIEGNYLVTHSPVNAAQRVTVQRVLDSRRVVGGSFFLATAVVSVGVLVGSILVFAIAPRIGIGFLTGGIRRRMNVVGFGDEVKLGQHGLISSDNQAVVMRAKVASITRMKDKSEREPAISGLYWRGTVYDIYRDSQWLRSRSPSLRTQIQSRPSREGGTLYFTGGPEAIEGHKPRYDDLEGLDRQEIQIVGLTHPVAFALDMPIVYEMPSLSVGTFTSVEVEPRYSGESALRTMRVMGTGRKHPMADFNGASYAVYSRDSIRISRQDVARPWDTLPEAYRKRYLQVPASLSPKVYELARNIVKKETTRAGKAHAIMTWLQKNKSYSANLQRNDSIPDPLEDFLFTQTAGHCEYFASSLAILGRLAGVPTRYVNGFLGGEWNDLSGSITVRDNRAHSWVEGYFDGFGWTRLDATPATSQIVTMNGLQQLIDSAELWWGTWIMEYDAARQIRLARKLAKKAGLQRGAGNGLELPRVEPKTIFLALVIGVLLVMGYKTLVRRLRNDDGAKPQRPRGQTRGFRNFQQAVAMTKRFRLHREEYETPRAYVSRVEGTLGQTLLDFHALARVYERSRFGEQELPPEERDQAQESLDKLTQLFDQIAAQRDKARPEKPGPQPPRNQNAA